MIALWLAEVRAGGVRRALRLAVVVVTLVTTAFLVAAPRAADRAYDRALSDRVQAAEDGLRDITLRLSVEAPFGAYGVLPDTVELHTAQPPFERVDAVARRRLGPDVVDLVGAATHAAQTDPFVLARRDRPLTVEPPQAVIRIQSGLEEQVEWVAGAAPGAPTQSVTVPIPVLEGSEPLQRRLDVVPVALAEETAALWGVEVGDRFDVTAANFQRGSDEDGLVEVAGVFRPLDPRAAFWRADARMLGTAPVPGFDGGVISQGALLAGEESYGPLAQSFQPMPARAEAPETTSAFEHSWRYRVDAEGLTSADAQVLRDGVARLRSAPGGWDGDPPTVATGLSSVLDRYAQDVLVASVLTLFAGAGVAALAAVTLMAGVLALLRVRAGELRLLVARGMSRRQLGGLLAGDVLVRVVPAVVAASAVVLLGAGALGAGTLGAGTFGGDGAVPLRTWVLVGAVAAAPVILALWAARGAHLDAGRRGGRRVPAGRRAVLELAVLALAVLLVLQLRGRAGTIAAGTADEVAALVPAVTGLAAGLVVLRVLPLLGRAVAALAHRGRGATALFAAAGMRASTVAALPLLALVIGASLVSLLATVGTATGADRAVVAERRVGADARVDAVRVDSADLELLRSTPGVAAVTAAFVRPDTVLAGSGASAEVELVAGDVAELAAAREGTAAALGSAVRVGREPVVEGGALAVALSRAVLPDETVELRVGGQRIPARVVAVDDALARVVDGALVDTALVDLTALLERVTVQPTTAFVTARNRGSDPLSAVPQLPLEVDRQSRVAVVDAAAGQATARLVTGTFVASAVVAGLLLALAVGLLVLATRDARALLDHRAQILGMPVRQRSASELLGLLPAVLVVALAGASLGSVLPRLVGPAIDVSSLTGDLAGRAVAPQPLIATAVGAGTVVLVLLALAVDRAVARRRSLQSTLREGEPS